MAHIALTAHLVKTLTCETGKPKSAFFDSDCKGLMLEVRISGGKTFYLRYQDERGKTRQIKLADAADVRSKGAVFVNDIAERILTNPNCATVVLAMALAPLRQFGITSTIITTLQAISGAGYPGVPSWDILGNIIPHIGGGEEEKIETETKKILGTLGASKVIDHSMKLSATTTRVPVRDGHTGSISVGLEQKPTPEAVIDAWRSFRGRPQELGLPSAPKQPIVYLDEVNRPQPLLDANRDGGMTVSVGRLRACPLFDYKFVALGHNTIRGAAGAAILNAELLHAEGRL